MVHRLLRMVEQDGGRRADLVLLRGAVFGMGLMRLRREGRNHTLEPLRVFTEWGDLPPPSHGAG